MIGWSAAAAPAAVAAAVLLLPGLLVGRAAGLRGLLWTAAAPALSVGVIALAAVAAAATGHRWGLLPVAVGTAAAVLVALPVGLLSGTLAGGRRRAAGRRGTRRGPVALDRRDLVVGLSAAGGLLAGGLLAGRRLLSALWDPTAVSQSYDVLFHLNAVRRVLDTGDGSSLHLGLLTDPTATTSFYPAGWHDVVALAAGTTGVGVDVATNATAVVVALLVWPLAVVGLVRAVLGRRPVALAAAGALTAAFTAQPIAPLEWGVLYPTLLTTSLVPASLALLVVAADRTRAPRPRLGALLAAAGTLPGLALAQPSGGFALAALALPLAASLLLATTAAWWRAGSRVLAVALPVAAVVVAAAAWRAVDTAAYVVSARGTDWTPMATVPQALEQAALFSHLSRAGLDRPPLWVAAALVLAGLAVALRRRGLRWVVAAHVLLSGLYVLAWAVDSPLSQTLTGFWFNDAYRISGLPVITGVVLASAALSLLPGSARRAVRHLRGAGAPAPERARLVAAAVAPAAGPRSRQVHEVVAGGERRAALETGRRAALDTGRLVRADTGRRAALDTGQLRARGRRRAAPLVRVVPAARWAVVSLGAAAVVVVVVLAGARGPGYAATYGALWANSATTPDTVLSPDGTVMSDLLDTDERTLLDRVAAEVPAGVSVAGNPWNGSALVYAIADRPTPFPHMTSVFDGPRQVVADRLDAAASDPTVCPAVRALHLGYVLDLGSRHLWGGDPAGRDLRYPGLEGLATSEGFQLVDSEGHARLYAITACGAVTPSS